MPLKNLLHLNFRASRRGQAPYMGVQCIVASESSWSNRHVSAQMASGRSFLNLWRSMVTACPKLTVKVKLAFSSSFCLSLPLPTPLPTGVKFLAQSSASMSLLIAGLGELLTEPRGTRDLYLKRPPENVEETTLNSVISGCTLNVLCLGLSPPWLGSGALPELGREGIRM